LQIVATWQALIRLERVCWPLPSPFYVAFLCRAAEHSLLFPFAFSAILILLILLSVPLPWVLEQRKKPGIVIFVARCLTKKKLTRMVFCDFRSCGRHYSDTCHSSIRCDQGERLFFMRSDQHSPVIYTITIHQIYAYTLLLPYSSPVSVGRRSVVSDSQAVFAVCVLYRQRPRTPRLQ
jgi:hypothetical protein